MRTCSRIAAVAAVFIGALGGVPRPLLAKQGADDTALLAKVDSIAAKVSSLRGLKIKHKIARGVMTRAQVRKRLLEMVAQEYAPEDLAAEELALKRLGMLDPDVDYKKLVIDLLTDQIAGFYDPKEKRLYLAGWQQINLPGTAQDPVMAHEIDHALQDQHFDLEKLMKDDKHNGDVTVARQALVEGDGVALMVEFMMADIGSPLSPWANDSVVNMMSSSAAKGMGFGKFGKVPLVLQESLLFPYTEGLRFVVHFRKHHPWSRIDKVYAKLPLSTEHILHPSKYDAYERPDEIATKPVAVLAGYDKFYDNVSGELGLSVFLRQHGLARAKAEQAAAGWGGDRLAVYTPAGHDGKVAGTVAIDYVVFDAEADAIEYIEALEDALAALSGVDRTPTKDGTILYRTKAGEELAAQRRDDSVVMVVGAPAGKATKLIEQVWSSWSVVRR